MCVIYQCGYKFTETIISLFLIEVGVAGVRCGEKKTRFISISHQLEHQPLLHRTAGLRLMVIHLYCDLNWKPKDEGGNRFRYFYATRYIPLKTG